MGIHQVYDPPFYAVLLSLVPPDMLLVYVNIYFLIPRLLLEKKFTPYLAALLCWLSIMAALGVGLHRLYAAAGITVFSMVREFNSRNFFIQLLNGIYLVGLTTGLKFLKDWMIQKEELQEKEQQRVDTELNFLKSQIHPHFFFNTLNNLYSLTLDKSDLAPEVVRKLADLMSYLLYEAGAVSVSLQREISHLENYIDLERLRFGDRLAVSFERKSALETIQIPPLILLAFVENSFKHGMNQVTGDGQITILLQTTPGFLLFEVTNPIEKSPVPEKNGFGLKNVIRRLDLLYEDRYQLDLSETEGQFHILLKIPLP